MKNINNSTCRWMRVNGELVPFSAEMPDITGGNVKVKYYLTKEVDSLEEEFKDNDYVHSVDLSSMKTDKLQSIKGMCSGCSSLQTLTLSDKFNESIDYTDVCPSTVIIEGVSEEIKDLIIPVWYTVTIQQTEGSIIIVTDENGAVIDSNTEVRKGTKLYITVEITDSIRYVTNEPNFEIEITDNIVILPNAIKLSEVKALQNYLFSDLTTEFTLQDNVSIAESLEVKGVKEIVLNGFTLSNKPAGVPMFSLYKDASVKVVYPTGKLDWTILTQGVSVDPNYKVVWNAGTKTLSLVVKTELDKVKEFLASGNGTYQLNEDITTTTMLYPGIDGLTLDLNGHTILNGTIKSTALNANFILIQVPQGRTFTIKDSVGTGKVDAGGKLNTKSSVAVKVQDNSILNIESGNFFVDVPDTGGANSCIYVESGIANISGGKFESVGSNNNGIHFVLNMLDNSNSTINVTGGEFVDFDPSKPMTEPNKEISFVKEGYKVITEDNIYKVVAE